ncbi:MAG: efflux RND transporter permease subunit [Proteocatella sp.]
MNLTKFSIKRPVTVIMSIVIIMLFGGVSLSKLPLDLLPNFGLTYAAVITQYRGAGPYEVENMVTKQIEDALGTVSSLKNMTSESTDGNSLIMIEFEDGTDMDFATLQMREKVDLIKGSLPDGVESPMVLKFDPSMAPILYISAGADMPLQKLSTYVEDSIKQKIERVAGVASVSVEGKEEREISVELFPEKLLGYGLSQSQIVNVLQSENNNVPGGRTAYGEKNIVIRTVSKFVSVQDISNIPINLQNGNQIKLSDVAEITDSVKEEETISRLNGDKAVMISIQKQSTANTVQVINNIKKELDKITTEDDSVDLVILFDQAKFIEQVLRTVFSNAVFGGLLAIAILWLFLKNFKMALSIGTAIPISVVATLSLIYFSGITLNMISLGGLALGIGMLVDNAIVVLENIYRYHTLGYSRYDSAVNGTKEISSAVIASTMTSVVVFLPIIFLSGFAAKIFRELAMTVSFSLATSLLVSLTVIPLLCYIMLGIDERKEKEGLENPDGSVIYKVEFVRKGLAVFDRGYEELVEFYRQIIDYAIENRKKTVAVAVAVFLGSLALIPFMGAEFIPQTDEGQISVSIELPKGKKLEETNLIVKKIEKYLMSNADVEKTSTVVGSGSQMQADAGNQASITAILMDKKIRKNSTADVTESIRKYTNDIPGCQINVTQTQSMGMGGGSGAGSEGVSLKIYGNDIGELKRVSLEIEKIMASVEGVRGIKSSLSDGAPELQIIVNKDRAASFGLTASQIASTVRGMVDGVVATQLSQDGEEIDVRVRAKTGYFDNAEEIKNISIQLQDGAYVPLSAIADIKLEKGPSLINRENKERVITLSSEIYNRDIKSVNQDIKKVIDKYEFPEGYRVSFGGQFDMMIDAFVSLAFMLILSTLLVYIVMAMQFESLIYPFIIMFSIPFALSGSLILTFLSGKSISIITFIGVIVLVGIVVNNSIVLVDYINTLRASGMDKKDAIKQSGLTRLKPILMTALTTIIGLIPLFLSKAEGAEMQSSLAAVVIGGLTFSTVLTLVIVPIMYYILDEYQSKMAKRFFKIKPE